MVNVHVIIKAVGLEFKKVPYPMVILEGGGVEHLFIPFAHNGKE